MNIFPKLRVDGRAAMSQPGPNRRCLKHIEPAQHDHGVPMLSRSNFMRQLGRELVASRLWGHLFDRGFGGAQLKVHKQTDQVGDSPYYYNHSLLLLPTKQALSIALYVPNWWYPCFLRLCDGSFVGHNGITPTTQPQGRGASIGAA